MSKIIQILKFEEGFREKPHIDTEGYPTVGTGFKIGPKGAPLSHYQFTLPEEVSDVWLQSLVDTALARMVMNKPIIEAMEGCSVPRKDVLVSMAYQMGVAGLAGFKNTLAMIARGDFDGASAGMLNSKWAKQTPARAKRHAEVMRTGTYDAYNGLLK